MAAGWSMGIQKNQKQVQPIGFIMLTCDAIHSFQRFAVDILAIRRKVVYPRHLDLARGFHDNDQGLEITNYFGIWGHYL